MIPPPKSDREMTAPPAPAPEKEGAEYIRAYEHTEFDGPSETPNGILIPTRRSFRCVALSDHEDALAAARREEREKCAKIAEDVAMPRSLGFTATDVNLIAEQIAARIRVRGEE